MTETMAAKPATTRIPRQLRESDVHGKGAAEIGWGTPGDFARCQAFMRRHDVPAHEIDGACANLHRIATGEWPGKNAHKGHLASIAVISLTAAAGPADADMVRWHGPLALVGEATGDRRRFPHDTLKYQTFPQPFRFQRQGLPGHQGAVTVGVIEHAQEQTYPDDGPQKELRGKRVIWGSGYFLDAAIIPEVKEAIHLAENGVTGPSVDLDSYTAVLKKNTMSGETTADMVRGRQRAATLVSVPAFADLRITVVHPKALTASSDTSDGLDATFAVNATGWHGAPIAPREALFDADDAAKRIEGWANGDPKKMASMFLWIDDTNGPLLGRKGYRLPWGDIIDGKPYLIYHAVYAAAALLQGGHGGLPNIPEQEKSKLRSVISGIYESLADEFGDPSIVAPWDRAAQQASGEAEWISGDGDEYDCYVSSFTAALEEFVRHHRYTEAKHPRDKRKNDHAGEWIDTPHGPHGQIKVGNKWVYPPKRGEKGYKNPEKAVRGIAKRGGGKSGGEGEAKRGPSTHVVKKAKPQPEHERRKKAPAAKAPARKAVADQPSGDDRARSHLSSMDGKSRLERADYLKRLKDEDIDNLVRFLGGSRHKDDTRDDLEIEILHQMEKDKGDATKSKRATDQKNAQHLRTISHSGGHKTTTIAKKKPVDKPKPAPAKKATVAKKAASSEHKLTPAQSTALDNLRKDEGAKVHPATRKVLQREGYLDDDGKLTDKGRGGSSPQPKQAPAAKAAPAKTTVVSKKTGEPKEHKLTAAQDKALKSLGDDPNAKVHPATRKVLQREGYLDDDGKLTDKGAKVAGVDAKKVAAPAAPAAKPHRLTANQKDDLIFLRNGGNPAFVNGAVLKREGYIDADGKLTPKGVKAADDLLKSAPPPPPKPPPPPPPSKAPQLGDPRGHSPRSIPSDLPKLKETETTKGPMRPKIQSERERDLEIAEEDLRKYERHGDEWTRSWEDGLAQALASGDQASIDYYTKMVKVSRNRIPEIKARIAEIKKVPHDPDGYDKPKETFGQRVGTPTPDQIDDIIDKILAPIPRQFAPQLRGQLQHQGVLTPRSMATLGPISMIDDPDMDGINARYWSSDRRIEFNANWQKIDQKRVEIQTGYNTGWYSQVEDGTVGIEGTLAHEFGHHLAFRALANERHQELLDKIVDEYGLKVEHRSYSDIQDALKNQTYSVSQLLSTYGTSSLQEFLADIWREYSNGGPRTRPKTKIIAELLRELAEEEDI